MSYHPSGQHILHVGHHNSSNLLQRPRYRSLMRKSWALTMKSKKILMTTAKVGDKALYVLFNSRSYRLIYRRDLKLLTWLEALPCFMVVVVLVFFSCKYLLVKLKFFLKVHNYCKLQKKWIFGAVNKEMSSFSACFRYLWFLFIYLFNVKWMLLLFYIILLFFTLLIIYLF